MLVELLVNGADLLWSIKGSLVSIDVVTRTHLQEQGGE